MPEPKIENTADMASGGRGARSGGTKAARRAHGGRTKAARGSARGGRAKTARGAPRRRSTAARRRRYGTPLLWLAGVRTVLSIAAIPAAAALFRDHFVVLVLLRPTKEVLLAGGFQVRRGQVSLLALVLAAVPLLVLGVWHFFALGRLYRNDLTGLPRWAQKVLPPAKIDAMCAVLAKRGVAVVVLGRLAAFPSSVVAAAAGASNLPVRRFLVADATGALLSFVEMVGAGYALGEAYERAGPWVTVGGVVTLAALTILVGQRLRKI